MKFVPVFFVVSVIAAINLYPGGNIHNYEQIGYVLSHNFLSDLGRFNSFTGEPNFLSMFLFNQAMFAFLIVGIAFLFIPNLYKDNKGVRTLETVISLYDIATIKFDKIESEENIFKNVLQILKDCPYIPYNKKSEIRLNYYEYKKHSGINWHDDGQDTLNYSFYIHKEWNENWGGETLINTNRGLPLSVTPNPNSLVVIKSGIRHKVCPYLFTLG